jgi:heme exporter protein B
VLNTLIAILRKDFVLELRTRYGLNGLVLFVAISVSIVAYSLAGVKLGSFVESALFWNTVFFAAMSALQRGFVSEVEKGTDLFLKLSAPATSVFFGKFLFNLVQALGLNILIALSYIIILNMAVFNYVVFVSVIVLGSFAISAAVTLISAIVANTNSRSGLFAVLSFPILLPAILLLVKATDVATTQDAPFVRAATELELLAAYAVMLLASSVLLFDFVWND